MLPGLNSGRNIYTTKGKVLGTLIKTPCTVHESTREDKEIRKEGTNEQRKKDIEEGKRMKREKQKFDSKEKREVTKERRQERNKEIKGNILK